MIFDFFACPLLRGVQLVCDLIPHDLSEEVAGLYTCSFFVIWRYFLFHFLHKVCKMYHFTCIISLQLIIITSTKPMETWDVLRWV